MKKITIIGAGSWGTTLSVLVAENGFDVTLWVREKSNADSILKNRENKQYLPGIKIPENVVVDNSLDKSVENAD